MSPVADDRSPLLYLVHRIPFPPNKGDKVRSFNILRQLARRHRVFLGTFVDHPDDAAHVGRLAEWCEESHVVRLDPRLARVLSLRGLLGGEALSLPYYRDAGLRQWVADVVAREGIRQAVAFSGPMAQYLDVPGLDRRIIDFCDLDSAKWTQYAPDHRWPMSWLYRREGAKLLAFERQAAAPGTPPALQSVSLAIEAGEFVAVMGPSGSGKSTFMNLVGLLDTPTGGTYRLNGQNVAGLTTDELAHVRNRVFGFVFQGFNLLKRITASENVALPMVYAGTPGAERRRRAGDLLAKVGLAPYADAMPNRLSGGQQQRVAIARSLANHPQLILADEPTGNLDTQTSAEIMALFTTLNRETGDIGIV